MFSINSCKFIIELLITLFSLSLILVASLSATSEELLSTFKSFSSSSLGAIDSLVVAAFIIDFVFTSIDPLGKMTNASIF